MQNQSIESALSRKVETRSVDVAVVACSDSSARTSAVAGASVELDSTGRKKIPVTHTFSSGGVVTGQINDHELSKSSYNEESKSNVPLGATPRQTSSLGDDTTFSGVTAEHAANDITVRPAQSSAPSTSSSSSFSPSSSLPKSLFHNNPVASFPSSSRYLYDVDPRAPPPMALFDQMELDSKVRLINSGMIEEMRAGDHLPTCWRRYSMSIIPGGLPVYSVWYQFDKMWGGDHLRHVSQTLRLSEFDFETVALWTLEERILFNSPDEVFQYLRTRVNKRSYFTWLWNRNIIQKSTSQVNGHPFRINCANDRSLSVKHAVHELLNQGWGENASTLNGNQGSFTNTDDHADETIENTDLPVGPVRTVIHANRFVSGGSVAVVPSVSSVGFLAPVHLYTIHLGPNSHGTWRVQILRPITHFSQSDMSLVQIPHIVVTLSVGPQGPTCDRNLDSNPLVYSPSYTVNLENRALLGSSHAYSDGEGFFSSPDSINNLNTSVSFSQDLVLPLHESILSVHALRVGNGDIGAQQCQFAMPVFLVYRVVASNLTDVRISDVSPTSRPLWISDRRQLPALAEADGVREVERDRHNRVMHALNGNTSCPAAAKLAARSVRRNLPNPEAKVLVPDDPELVAADLVKHLRNKYGMEWNCLIHFVLGRPLLKCGAYASLATDEEEVCNLSADPDEKKDETVSGVTRPKGGFGGPRGGRPKHDKPDQTGPPELTEEQKLARMNAILDRVIKKATREDSDGLSGYFMRVNCSRRFMYSLSVRAWGPEWTADSADQKTLSLLLMKDSRRLWGLRLLATVNEKAMRDTLAIPQFRDCIRMSVGPISEKWCDTCAVTAEEQAAHNAEMHRLHGNTVTSSTFSDVEQAPSFMAMCEPTSVPPVEPGQLVARRLNTPVGQGVMAGDTEFQMPLLGTVLTEANATANDRGLAPCEQMMYPSALNKTIAPIGAIQRPLSLPWVSVGCLPARGLKMSNTALYDSIIEGMAKNSTNVGRPDTLVLGGYLLSEVASIARKTDYYGLDMTSCVTKLLLLAKTYAWEVDRRYLPVSGFAQGFDPRCRIADPSDAGYNPANLFSVTANVIAAHGEDLGGNACVLPFRNGEDGSLSFHLTLDTVPYASKDNVIFLPVNFLSGCDNPAAAIALFVIMLADWPSVNYVVTSQVIGPAGQIVYRHFSPFTSCVAIPGLVDIHIVLPRNSGTRNPMNQDDANSGAWFRPASGPTASANFAADDPLDVNWIGGALSEYKLAEYVYTWKDYWTVGDINQFLNCMNDVTNINELVPVCEERIAMWITRYPLLRVTNDIVQGDDPNVKRWRTVLADGRVIVPDANPLPYAGFPPADYLMTSFNGMAWNQVVVRTSVVSSGPTTPLPLSGITSRPDCLLWSLMLTRTYAVARHVLLYGLGFAAESWNTTNNMSSQVQIKDIVRSFFSRGQDSNSVWLRPPGGVIMAHVYQHVIGFANRADVSGCTVWDLVCPSRHEAAMPINPTDDTRLYPECVPGWLPNLWLWVTAVKMPLRMMPPPPNGLAGQSVRGFADTELKTIRFDNADYGPKLTSDNQANTVGPLDTRDLSEKESWNVRLMYDHAVAHQVLCRVRSWQRGVGVACPDSFSVPRSQAVTGPDLSMRGYQDLRDDRVSSLTFVIPSNDDTGEPLFPVMGIAVWNAFANVEAGRLPGTTRMLLMSNDSYSPEVVIRVGQSRSAFGSLLSRSNAVVASIAASVPAASGGGEAEGHALSPPPATG